MAALAQFPIHRQRRAAAEVLILFAAILVDPGILGGREGQRAAGERGRPIAGCTRRGDIAAAQHATLARAHKRRARRDAVRHNQVAEGQVARIARRDGVGDDLAGGRVGVVQRLAQDLDKREVGVGARLASPQRDGDQVARRRVAARNTRVGLVHIHDVLTGRQPRKGVQPGAVRGGGPQQRLARIQRAVAVGVLVQVHRDKGDRGIPRVEHAVFILVAEDLVADGARHDAGEAKVGVEIAAAQARHGQRIARRGDPGRRAEVARDVGVDHVHDIVQTGRQAGEQVVARWPGRRRGDQGILAGINTAVTVGVFIQIDGDASDAHITRAGVVGAVIALVLVDQVADGARAARLVAEVNGQVDLVLRQRDRARVAAGCQGIAAGQPARARRRRVHAVRPRVEAREQVLAVQVRRGGLDDAAAGRAGAGVQVQRHAGQTLVGRVLHAVAVPIAEDGVADAPAADNDAAFGTGGNLRAGLCTIVGIAVLAG